MLINLTWIWTRWSYHAQESPWCMIGLIAYLIISGPLYVGVVLLKILLLCEGGGGACLLLSFLLLSTRNVRYLIAIWWIFFMVLFISASGICSFLRSFVLLVCIAPLTPTVIIIRGLDFKPCAFIAFISGLYLVFLVCMACSINMSCVLKAIYLLYGFPSRHTLTIHYIMRPPYVVICPRVPNTCVNLFSLLLVINESLWLTKEYWMKMSILHNNYSIRFVCWVGPRIS